MTEIALPRVRTRRKKRKPPSPWFIYWTLYTLWCFVWAIREAMWIYQDGPQPLHLFAFAIQICCGRFVGWPIFKREWDAWRNDE